MSTTMYLVRHAEAEGNISRRCHGQYDSLLTRRGLAQAEVVGERFRGETIDAVYSSDLWRARHTALAIAQPHGLPVIERKALREIDMGEWEDKAWAELPVFQPELYDIWCNRPWLCRAPGGETIMEAGLRALEEMRRIAREQDGKTVVVVSHGSAIRGILTRALGLRDDQMMQVGWGDNTCVAKMIFHADGAIDVPYQNDNSHLPKELSTFHALQWSDSVDVPVSPQMWFRPVNWEDAADKAAALEMFHQIYWPTYGKDTYTDEQIEARLRGFQSVTPDAVAFGMVGREIGGIIAINTLENRDTEIGEMGGTCVLKKYRGFGFTPQLVGHAVSVYRRMGKKVLQSVPAKHNPGAIEFYQRNEFEPFGDYADEHGEFLVMRRNIEVK
ncbi:MAG TPA: GNAT family N-acetyltransferase [Candidatus Butyricicoccus stercorigallinarum]|nr:GNAT family N-acetyltransferase [Candidatus Butyricicoccus stercorigallinarum]